MTSATTCLGTEVVRDFTRKGHSREEEHRDWSPGKNPEPVGRETRACCSSPRPEKCPLLMGHPVWFAVQPSPCTMPGGPYESKGVNVLGVSRQMITKPLTGSLTPPPLITDTLSVLRPQSGVSCEVRFHPTWNKVGRPGDPFLTETLGYDRLRCAGAQEGCIGRATAPV